MFNDLQELMHDEDFDRLLHYVTQFIAKPEIKFAQAAQLIVQLQAMSAKFALAAKHYMVFGTTKEDSRRKNVYFTAAEQANALAQALKYYVK